MGVNPLIVVVAEAKAWGDELAQKLEEAERELATLAKQLEGIRGNNQVME